MQRSGPDASAGLSRLEAPMAPPEVAPAPAHGAAGRIDAVHLDDGLRKVQADHDNGHGKAPPESRGTLHAPTFRSRTGAVHAIKRAVQRARYMSPETIAPVGR